MVMSSKPQDSSRTDSNFSRRSLLGAISAAGVALAGCSSGDDNSDGQSGGETDGESDGGSSGDSQEMGERVPTISFAIWSNYAPAATMDRFTPIVVQNLSDLGLDVEQSAIGALDLLSGVNNDQRNHHVMANVTLGTSLNPTFFLRDFQLAWAGANGETSESNYADCEYDEHFRAQRQTADSEERQEFVLNALRRQSNDVSHWPLMKIFYVGGWNTNYVRLNPDELGERGINGTHHNIYIGADTVEDQFIAGVGTAITASPIANLINSGTTSFNVWNNLVYSPLMELDPNFETVPCVATGYEVSDDNTEYTFNIGDTTFHNGDPVTAEDVKFTFDLVVDNYDLYPNAAEYPIENITVEDDSTVVFKMSDASNNLINSTIYRWGIVPKDIYLEAGARESPDSFDPGEVIDDDNLAVVGSGPFRLTSRGESLNLEPFDGHRKYQPSYNMIFQGFSDNAAKTRAFQQGEIHFMSSVPIGQVEGLQERDQFEIHSTTDFTNYKLNPQNSFPPFQFQEMREAGHRALNRNRINQVASLGLSEAWPIATAYNNAHPSIPQEDTSAMSDDGYLTVDPAGDVEGARGLLEEEGYGWDDSGRLHYPPDKDLTPAWPKESEPAEHPEDFPCVEDWDSS